MVKITKKQYLLILIMLVIILGFWGSFNLGKNYAIKKIPELSLSGSIQFDEETQKTIIEKARKQIDDNSVIGSEYVLVANRIIGGWIVFDVYPFNRETDNAQLFVEYNGGDMKFYGPATSFEGLWNEHPELFY